MAEENKSEEKKENPETITMAKSDFQEAIKLSLESFVKETGITKVAEIGIEAKKVLEKENPGYAFHKALMEVKNGGGADYRAKAMTVGTDADGGYLVPDLTEARIMDIIKTAGQARQLMTVMPMKGNILTIPAELVSPTVSWVDEGVSIAISNATLQPITLTPKKAAVIAGLSNELMLDANPDIGNYIMMKMAESYYIAEDTAIFGSATSPFTSLFYTGNTYGGTTQQSAGGTTPAPTYALLVSALLAIDQSRLLGASWLFSRSVFALVKNILDGNSLPIFSPATENVPATILGYPVTIVEKAPSSALVVDKIYGLLGNFKGSLIGDVTGMTFAVSNSGTVGSVSAFEYDLTYIRLTKRTAYNNGILAHYSALKCAHS